MATINPSIRFALRTLYRKGDIVEIRALKPPEVPYIGRFTYGMDLLNALESYDRDKDFDLYVCLNPTSLRVTPMDKYQYGTKKPDVPVRRWFLLDGDPQRDWIREAGQPVQYPVINKKTGEAILDTEGQPKFEQKREKVATEEEWQRAYDVMQRAKQWLESLGWDGIVMASSGNGCHLLVPCDLPNDDAAEQLIKIVQNAVSARFSTEDVLIECFFDSDRITRAYGSLNRKGRESAHRKYRRSGIVEIGSVRAAMAPLEIMRWIATEFPLPENDTTDDLHEGEGLWDSEMVEDVLRGFADTIEGFEFDKTNRYDGWRVTCPGNQDGGWGDGREHGDKYGHPNDSSIVYVKDGHACFVCKHNACDAGRIHITNEGRKELAKKKFRDFVDFYDPELELYDHYPYPPTAKQTLELLAEFEAEEAVLSEEYLYRYVYEGPKGRIFSDDGINWVKRDGTKIQ